MKSTPLLNKVRGIVIKFFSLLSCDEETFFLYNYFLFTKAVDTFLPKVQFRCLFINFYFVRLFGLSWRTLIVWCTVMVL